jgi:hypothetical protein
MAFLCILRFPVFFALFTVYGTVSVLGSVFSPPITSGNTSITNQEGKCILAHPFPPCPVEAAMIHLETSHRGYIVLFLGPTSLRCQL